jgi:ankyrin repeat protein
MGEDFAPSEHNNDDNFDSDYDDNEFIGPLPLLGKDPVEEKFEEILTKVRHENPKLGQRDVRNQFLQQYGDYFEQKTQVSKQNFLHLIASRLGHGSLIRCVLRKNKHLLEQRDDNSKTPLHIAIVHKNAAFLDVVQKDVKGSDFDRLLQEVSEHGRNCIHAAIHYALDTEYTVKLINGASDTTLSATDDSGLTPLHLAVEYDRSSTSQLSIVQALIAHGDSAFDQYTRNPSGLSVYEYHQHTRQQAQRQNRIEAETDQARQCHEGHVSHIIGDRGITEIPAVTFEGLPQDPESIEPPGEDPRDSQQLLPTSLMNKSAPRAPPTRLTADQVKLATKDPMSMPPTSPNAPEGFGLRRRSTGGISKSTRAVKEGSERQKALYADSIRREIKLHYLRTTFRRSHTQSQRDQLAASKFLYGLNIQSRFPRRKSRVAYRNP